MLTQDSGASMPMAAAVATSPGLAASSVALPGAMPQGLMMVPGGTARMPPMQAMPHAPQHALAAAVPAQLDALPTEATLRGVGDDTGFLNVDGRGEAEPNVDSFMDFA
jgi:hypothetical protein